MGRPVVIRECFVALGSNRSWRGAPRRTVIMDAMAALEEVGQVRARSGLWRSPAWPDRTRPSYVNAVVRLTCPHDPASLLAELHAIEAAFGRERTTERWADRTLDLDLISVGDVVVDETASDGLTLPHPRISDRAFVLLPLKDVAPLWTHPVSGRSVQALIDDLSAQAREGVKRTQTPAARAPVFAAEEDASDHRALSGPRPHGGAT